jgi:predicted ArsR family transcriptional regulator
MLTIPEMPEDSATYALTEQQERVWKQMRLLQSLNGGRPATQTEISKALGLKSKQGCAVHFEPLSRMGYIVCTKANGWRCWLAVDPDPARPLTPYTRNRTKGFFKNSNSYIPEGAKFDTSKPLDDDGFIVDQGPTEEEGLSDRAVETWRVMYRLQSMSAGSPPTQQQISQALGMSSVQGARSHLTRLVQTGYVVHSHRKWYAVIPPHKRRPDFYESDDTANEQVPASSDKPVLALESHDLPDDFAE